MAMLSKYTLGLNQVFLPSGLDMISLLIVLHQYINKNMNEDYLNSGFIDLSNTNYDFTFYFLLSLSLLVIGHSYMVLYLI